jgi:hypothetical protein
VDEGDWPKVSDCHSIRYLGEQDREGIICVVQMLCAEPPECVKRIHEIVLDHRSSYPEGGSGM